MSSSTERDVWYECFNSSGKVFYANQNGDTQWNLPLNHATIVTLAEQLSNGDITMEDLLAIAPSGVHAIPAQPHPKSTSLPSNRHMNDSHPPLTASPTPATAGAAAPQPATQASPSSPSASSARSSSSSRLQAPPPLQPASASSPKTGVADFLSPVRLTGATAEQQPLRSQSPTASSNQPAQEKWRSTWMSVFEGEMKAKQATGPKQPRKLPGEELGYTTEEIMEAFSHLPAMSKKTAHILARSYGWASQAKAGYADSRPALRADELQHAFRGAGIGGHTIGFTGQDTHYAAQMRAELYSGSAAAATLKKKMADGSLPKATPAQRAMSKWRGTGRSADVMLAPSSLTSGYAYQHAAHRSRSGAGGNVYDRLQDARGYTGIHRHRFDVSGRGRGAAGRISNDMDYESTLSDFSASVIPPLSLTSSEEARLHARATRAARGHNMS